MLTRNIFRRSANWKAACALIIGLPILYWSQPTLWLNLAQLQRTRSNSQAAAAAFDQSLALTPQNRRIREEAVRALLEIGKPEAARSMLLPLLGQNPVDTHTLDLLLAAGLEGDALHVYNAFDSPPKLTYQVAAEVSTAYLQQSGTLPLTSAQQATLLAQALSSRIDSPELQPLLGQLANKDFWPSEEGRHLRDVLIWRGRTESAGLVESDIPSPDKSNGCAVDSGERERVAAMLGKTPSEIQLGTDLVPNCGFEERLPGSDAIRGWETSFMTSGSPWNRATFVIGTDTYLPYAGERSLRIDGLAIETRPDREPARAGLWLWDSPPRFTRATPYAISLAYRTDQGHAPGAALYLYTPDPAAFVPEQSLPSTQGRWRRATLIIWNRSTADTTVAPLLRSFGEGSVWFDDFSLRPVLTRGPIAPREPLLFLEDPNSR